MEHWKAAKKIMRKSTLGYVSLLAGAAVLETIIASSTIEAEFIACFEATSQAVWLRNFITGLRIVDSISKPLKDKILLTLGCMDLDLALRVDEPLEPTDESSAAEKSAYDKWERSNRLSLMLIKSYISQSIRGSIPPSDKVKNYMRAIEEQFVSSNKALASTLMYKLSGMKHKNSRSVCEHIIEMRDITARLKSSEIEISESFLINFILYSLPVEYGAFQISYNIQKEKWSINELLTMCVQEEERLKHGKVEIAHLETHKGGQWKKGKGDQK
ncbi:uncharacterized protein LOC114261243 [Camellia sinensis]|uniref:uncharacterized protein LOC114261243 n=1 Tax=Camellia sinensis TaxID=4442 RepID=UPI001036094C|nr:uncharacterized protein LOC114261243 [Camellia sinensis]